MGLPKKKYHDLTLDELHWAEAIAIERYLHKRQHGYPDELAKDDNPIQNDTFALEAEIAAARCFDVEPNLEVGMTEPYDLIVNTWKIDVKNVTQGKDYITIRGDKPSKVSYYLAMVTPEDKPFRYELAGLLPAHILSDFRLRRGIRDGAPPYYLVKLHQMQHDYSVLELPF